MNIYDLTIKQLKRAAIIKQQIAELTKELGNIFGPTGASSKPGRNSRRAMSARARRKIAAAQKARWAKLRDSAPAARSARLHAKTAKKRMSPAARANLSAKLKAFWASKKKAAKR
jgi:hypothetical protein